MCNICVDAQDATPSTGDGATADAWARIDASFRAWLGTLSDDHPVHDMDMTEMLLAHARHIDEATTERVLQ